MNSAKLLGIAALLCCSSISQPVASQERHAVDANGAPCITGERMSVTGRQGDYNVYALATNNCDETIVVKVCNSEKSYSCSQIVAYPKTESKVLFGFSQTRPTYSLDFSE